MYLPKLPNIRSSPRTMIALCVFPQRLSESSILDNSLPIIAPTSAVKYSLDALVLTWQPGEISTSHTHFKKILLRDTVNAVSRLCNNISLQFLGSKSSGCIYCVMYFAKSLELQLIEVFDQSYKQCCNHLDMIWTIVWALLGIIVILLLLRVLFGLI